MFIFILLSVLLYSRVEEVPTVRPSIYKDLRPGEDAEFKEVYKERTGLSLFGRDFNKLFIRKKKLGTRRSYWYFQSFPILYPSVDTGFNYGGRLMLYNFKEKPYKYHFLMQYWASDRGRANHEFKFIVPNLFEYLYFRVQLRYFKRISARYFGIGDVENDQAYTDVNSPLYLTKVYYWYKLFMPNISLFSGLRFFDKKLMLYANYFFADVSISTHYEDRNSFVYTEQPFGIAGGKLDYIKFGVLYNTKEQETNPETGLLLDFAITRFSVFCDTYKFNSLGLSFAYFKGFPRYFVLASRLLISYLFGGNIPFFAYNYFYVNEDIEGLGGDTLRGYASGRFIDNLKTSLQFELRTRFYEAMIGDKLIEVDIVPFLDIGAIADSLSSYTLKTLKASYGASLRLIINNTAMIRVTLEHSPENTSMGLGFEENFK